MQGSVLYVALKGITKGIDCIAIGVKHEPKYVMSIHIPLEFTSCFTADSLDKFQLSKMCLLCVQNAPLIIGNQHQTPDVSPNDGPKPKYV